jgi:peptidoglycan-N-acetylglucosamine deacetylase
MGLLVAPVVAVLLWRWSPIAALGVLALSHMLVLYPTLRANAQWLGPVVTRFDTNANEIWLTIDDGPSEDTPALLEVLDRHSVKVTFFVKGELARQRPELIREIVRRGHSVGNHSQTHPSASFWCLPPAAIRREIHECNRVLAEVTGSSPRFFRAPVGMKNPFVHPALGDQMLIGWTARAFDAVTSDPDTVLRRLMPDVRPGAILLLHQGRPASATIVDAVVAELRKRGYALVVPDAGRLKTKR